MKTALMIAAVDPSIGGVLIRGHKGTAKTTAVRGFASLLPAAPVADDADAIGRDLDSEEAAPFVELPLGATEDRVIGTLHIERALTEGRREYEPGLLAKAHRGVLYVDEVNLLDDFLVDVLLDAAASGYNVVEREGVSVTHPSRFTLVGTMNPEEGELRPQFLDRFALCVSVGGIRDKNERLEVAKRSIAFESNREGFRRAWQKPDAAVREAIVAARTRLAATTVDDSIWRFSVSVAAAAETEGHRGDIAIVKAARALAALTEVRAVDATHVLEAARYVLPHRMAATAIETPESALNRLTELLAELGARDAPDSEADDEADSRAKDDDDPDDADGWDPDDAAESVQVPGAAASGSLVFDFLKKKLQSAR